MISSKFLLLLCLISFLSACSENKKSIEISKPFSKSSWDTSGFRGRGYMINDLLARKDSLLKNRPKPEIIALLGKPNEEINKELIGYFFEKQYPDDLFLSSEILIQFDTTTGLVTDCWWTD